MSSDYGTYRLTYTPPESTGQEDYPSIAIEMSTGGDANVDQMLRFFEAFLQASGYVLKGDLQIVEPEPGMNPWQITTQGSQGTDFIPFGSYGDYPICGGAGTDTITFSPAQSMQGWTKTWDDVISFG